jgi:hypothetical protein
MFLASGVPKYRRPFASALAMVRFGVLKRIRPRAGRLLGAVEVATGAALVVAPDPFIPVVVGVALLGTFTVLIAAALARGRSFDCACFGTDEQISWSTVARNLVFLAVAVSGAVAVRPGSGTPLPDADDRLLGALVGVLVMCGYLLLSTMARLRPFATTLDGTGNVDG